MDEVGPPIFDLDRVVDPTDWFGYDDRIRRWAQSVNLKAYTDVFLRYIQEVIGSFEA